MATTTNYGWTTPDDTALVKDGASAIRTLGTAIDTTTFNNASAAIAKTIVDAKGDIIAATAADTVSRLAVGANDTVLTADSTAATGLKWGAAPSGKPVITPQQSTYYLKPFITAALADFSIGITNQYFVPIYLPGFALDRISFRTATGFSGTSTVRLGIYNNDSTNKPSTVYLDAGTVSATVAGTNYEITISNTPPAGYYWLSINFQTTTGAAECASSPNASALIYSYQPPTSTINTTSYATTYRQTGITGAFATTTSLSPQITAIPLIAVRIQ